MHIFLWSVTGLALVISFVANREKTLQAVKIAVRSFVNILPAFLVMLILVSIVLFLVPDEFIARYLGSGNKFTGVLFASFIGSVTLMPGFIVFSLCGILGETWRTLRQILRQRAKRRRRPACSLPAGRQGRQGVAEMQHSIIFRISTYKHIIK